MKFLQAIKTGVGIALIAGLAWSCEDPNETFDPTNPNLSSDNVVGTIESSIRVLNGAERQFSIMINDVVTPLEIGTDNYQNTRTFFNQFLDDLAIDPTDNDVRDLQFNIARLRELCTTGINDILPGDDGSTGNEEAGLYFLRGMAYLTAGEVFSVLPGEAGGAALPAETHLNLAISDFTTAIGVAGGGAYSDAALLARARTHYRLGNRGEAVADANAAITATPDLLYQARFDGVNGPTNVMQDALWDRGTFDDLQPLPTLDFLDPKFNGSIPNVEGNVSVIKIEEAHLILAEAALSEGDLDGAKDIMKDIIGLVGTRAVATFDDAVEGRTHNEPGSRPDNAEVAVAAGPDRPLQEGLVINRQMGDVTVAQVSGTHYTDDDIDAVSDMDFAYETLYRMRQEIFLAEGRRFTDLGIRLVVAQVEADGNPSIVASDLEATIPGWLEPIKTEFDAFTYDAAAGTATVTHNLNRLTAANRGSDLVAPFE